MFVNHVYSVSKQYGIIVILWVTSKSLLFILIVPFATENWESEQSVFAFLNYTVAILTKSITSAQKHQHEHHSCYEVRQSRTMTLKPANFAGVSSAIVEKSLRQPINQSANQSINQSITSPVYFVCRKPQCTRPRNRNQWCYC